MIRHRRYQRMAAAASTLTDRERVQLDAHLATCALCRDHAEEYDRQDTVLRSLLPAAPPQSTLPAVLAGASAPASTTSGLRSLRRGSVIIFAVLALAVMTTAAFAAGRIIRVYHPENPLSPREAGRLFYAPDLPPYPTVRYRALNPSRAAAESGYAAAYLQNPPADISNSVGVDILPHTGWAAPSSPENPADSGLEIALRSVIRYRGSGHTVILALKEPSPKVIRTRVLVLGQRTVHLSNGQDAWVSDNVSDALPFVRPASGSVHVLSWVSGHYVVTLFSDLPVWRLTHLARQAVVVPPKADPSQRQIPSTWPTPLPLERLPARLRVRIDGAALSITKSSKLEVKYLFSLGSYSQGALYGQDKWSSVSVHIGFPSALRTRTHDRQPYHTFSGGSMAMGGSVTFNTAGLSKTALSRSLQRGLTVHMTWTEKGGRHHQTFRYPIIPASQCSRLDPTCAMALGIR